MSAPQVETSNGVEYTVILWDKVTSQFGRAAAFAGLRPRTNSSEVVDTSLFVSVRRGGGRGIAFGNLFHATAVSFDNRTIEKLFSDGTFPCSPLCSLTRHTDKAQNNKMCA
ncbi:unnamed protein product [Arctogadus glacialis]